MARAGWVPAVLLTIVGCSFFGQQPESPDDGTAIKLLAANPITGSLSFMGPALEAAMDLAADEVNQAGGILGRRLQLVKADTHSDEDSALREILFYYAENRDIVGILGASLDTISKRLLLDIAKNSFEYGHRIPIISPASTSAEFVGLLDAQYNLFLRTVCSSHIGGGILADKAVELGYGVGAVVGQRDINNTQVYKQFSEVLQRSAGGASARVYYYDEPSVNAIAATLAEAYADTQRRHGRDPAFLLLLAYGSDGKIVLNEWSRKYSSTPLLLPDSLMSRYFLASLDPNTLTRLDQAEVNGVFPISSAGSKGFSVFAERFCGEHPQHCKCADPDSEGCDPRDGPQPEIFTANAYDAVYTMSLGLALAGRDDPDRIRRGPMWDEDRLVDAIIQATNGVSGDELSIYPGQWAEAVARLSSGGGVDYEGASSTSLAFDLNGDPVNCSFSFWTIRHGQIVMENSDGQPERVAFSF